MKFVSAAHLTGGGTIGGDLTISGDLTVSGSGGYAYSEVITGDMAISSAATSDIITITAHTADVNASNLTLQKSRHADVGGQTVVQDNDSVGAVNFKGNDGDAYIETARIKAKIDGTVGNNSMPGELGFFTTAASGSSATERMTIKSAGNVGIGTASPSDYYEDYDDFVIKGSAHTGMTIVGGTSHRTSIAFSDGTSGGARYESELIYNHSTNVFSIGTAGSGRLFVDYSGNVGIGLAPAVSGTPSLCIEGTAPVFTLRDSSSSAQATQFFRTHLDAGIVYNMYDDGGTYRIGHADDVDGVNYASNFVLDVNSRISLSNNDSSGGASTTIFGYQAGNAIASGGAYNTIMGHNAALLLSTGEKNCVFGYTALDGASTEADDNVAIGYNAMGGDIGTEQVNDCVAIGSGALAGALDSTNGEDEASGTVAIGKTALSVLTTGYGNIAVGFRSLANITTGTHNLMIGVDAAIAANDTDFSYNVGVGNYVFDGALSGVDAQYNVAVGHAAMSDALTNTAHENTAVGYNALLTLASGESNTCIGSTSGDAIVSGSNNTAVGKAALTTSNGDHNNVAIGFDASNSTWGSSNVSIGKDALKGATFTEGGGSYNDDPTITHTSDARIIAGLGVTGTGIPDGAYISSITDGTHFELSASTTGGSLSSQTLTFYSRSEGTVAIGADALTALTTGAKNTAVGYSALSGLTTGANNIAIGYEAADAMVGGETDNIAIGYGAMGAMDEDNESIDNNIAIGTDAMKGGDLADTSRDYENNIAIGYQSMDGTGVVGGSDNVFIGLASGGGTWTGAASYYNVGIGNSVMDAAMAGALHNVAVGYNALTALTSGDSNVCVGSSAGVSISTAIENVAIGQNALATSASGHYNVAVGYYALASIGGPSNTAIGYQSLRALSSGANNIAVGKNSAFYYGSGTSNQLATSSSGVYLGDDCRANADSMTNEIVIGASSIGSGSYTTTIGSGNVFKFASKSYTCQYSDATDGDSASGDSTPLKLPAYSIIKSVSVIVTQLSDLAEFDVSLVHSTSSGAVADGSAPTGTPVEILGAGSGTTKRGSDGTATDINLAQAGEDGIIKQSYYNGFDGNGLHIGAADRWVNVVNADGNGDTNPSGADGIISVLVEYVGLD